MSTMHPVNILHTPFDMPQNCIFYLQRVRSPLSTSCSLFISGIVDGLVIIRASVNIASCEEIDAKD